MVQPTKHRLYPIVFAFATLVVSAFQNWNWHQADLAAAVTAYYAALVFFQLRDAQEQANQQ
jgi:hypothetical protein